MSSPGSPTVQVTNKSPFGNRVQDIKIDSNRFNPIEDFRFTTLHRLALPATFEHQIADTALWVSGTAFLTSVVTKLVVMGIVPIVAVGAILLAFAVPLALWSYWLNNEIDDTFKKITGSRAIMVLIGLLIGILI